MYPSSIFFATFSRYEKDKRMPTNGMVEPVLSFFLPKVTRLLLLDQPHLTSDIIDPIIQIYQNEKLVRRFTLSKFWYLPIYFLCKLPSREETRVSYKLRDFFSVLFLGLSQPETYDLFIGLEAVNALAGLVLKKIGKVKKVVYYVSDYSPIRFPNMLFNALYIWLDRFCLLHADYTWDVSLAMLKGRIEAGLPLGDNYRIIHVPNGLFPIQIKSLPINKRTKYDLVYMGILERDMGSDLAIRSLPTVLRRFPKTMLHIIGGPEIHIERMRAIVKKLDIEKFVVFHGIVPDNEKMATIIRNCYIGLAPYRSFPNSKRWYGDAGKIRQYTAAGLPFVTTHVPPLGRYIVKKGAGIMTKDTVKSFSGGILRLLSDDALYEKLSAGAINVSRDNTWENVYTKAFEDMKKMIE